MKQTLAAALIALAMLTARPNPLGRTLRPPEATGTKVFVVVLFEDGSYKLSDGTTGCLPEWICNE